MIQNTNAAVAVNDNPHGELTQKRVLFGREEFFIDVCTFSH